MSKQRKLRSKLSFDADEAEAADAPPPPPPASISSKKESSSKPKKSTLLSFGDDEEPLSTSSKHKKKDKGSAKVSKFSRGAATVSAPVAAAAAVDPGAAHKPTAGEPGPLIYQTHAVVSKHAWPYMDCSAVIACCLPGNSFPSVDLPPTWITQTPSCTVSNSTERATAARQRQQQHEH
jgi:hypothetical protein